MIVPPVPTEITSASSSPPVCSQISGPGRLVVRLRVRHVRVLVGLEAAGNLLGEPVGDASSSSPASRARPRSGVIDDLGAVGAQAARSSPGSSCPASRRCSGSRASAPRSRARRRCCPEVGSTIVPPGFSFPSRSAASIIASADPVLDRAARVEELELGEDGRPHVAGRSGRSRTMRRVADQVEQRSDTRGPSARSVLRPRLARAAPREPSTTSFHEAARDASTAPSSARAISDPERRAGSRVVNAPAAALRPPAAGSR